MLLLLYLLWVKTKTIFFIKIYEPKAHKYEAKIVDIWIQKVFMNIIKLFIKREEFQNIEDNNPKN